MERTSVVVAGAGPAGVIAAYKLAEAGVEVVLVEAHAECHEDMRASTFHAPTLDMLDGLGLLAALEAQGLKAPVYQYRNRRSGEVLAFDLGEIADVTKHPYRLQCEQYKLTRLVTGLLDKHTHAKVLFGRRVVHVEQDQHGATVGVETPSRIERYRADYVIGADGANSMVRKWLDIAFESSTYPERFLTLSTDWPLDQSFRGLANVNYMADTNEWCVLLRVSMLWRILVPANSQEPDVWLLSDEKKTAVFSGLMGDGASVYTQHRTRLQTAPAAGAPLSPGSRPAHRRCGARQQPAGRLRHEFRHPRRVEPDGQADRHPQGGHGPRSGARSLRAAAPNRHAGVHPELQTIRNQQALERPLKPSAVSRRK